MVRSQSLNDGTSFSLALRLPPLPSSQDHTEILTPIYNGYGNEDDLYAMGLSLEPLNTDVNQEEYDRWGI